jgi:tight adherence protein C
VTHDQLLVLAVFGGGFMALVAAACLMVFRGAADQEIANRISGLRQGAAVVRPRASHFLPVLVSLTRRLGESMRDRLMSSSDAEALGKTLAAAGFEPSKSMPIFVGAKVACLLGVPVLVYLGTVFLRYPTGKQLLFGAGSLAIGFMLPNWVIGLLRRPYQAALRRGIPDALDLMVVCAEAGLGLDSAIERVAREMKQSNRAVGVELSMLSYEMRILPDRGMALANLADRTGQPALKRLSGTIAQTLKYGTPLSEGLRMLAAEMREERMIQFEERAGRLPALLVLPMIVFILPCLFIIIMGEPMSKLMAVFEHMNH